ncbi:flagellar filament capping protein FliD [Arcobacter ellisii]|uniref:Flagellar hook-associated protein 2 n=1 Tax=Arcobacter ellisii TaxID=913109 RepID=A0A347U8A3_9BACT|nr:flagellar filament capping protein FliD [Arcobacter ellisii]AXX95081.1 flagellar filament cap protein FliD [Arcobacter ellisii]RXI30399.1 flagellar hook protein FliD [Arcobacter ellisii]
MADGILGLGSSGSVDLSSELITKLKTAESTATLDPITEEIEDTQAELDALTEIETMVLELLDLVDDFDLYTSGTNAFDEISATTSGDSVTFDATDSSKLTPGTISVSVSQLAQKDVYQSNTISDTTATMDSGTITITVGENSYDFSTDGKTYESLVTEMGYNSNFEASLEQVGDDSYRLVIKSSETGELNAISISQTDIDLGFEDEDSHVLTAQNMQATIDGISYDVSSNKVTMANGLIITATTTGDSSITMERDTSTLVSTIEEVADKYNDLVDLVNSYILGDEDDPATISDSSTLKTMMNSIKEILFGSYGLDDEESLFKYGISFDSDGYLNVDSTELTEAVTDNYDDLKELFVGYAEKEGIGTKLKTYLDSLDSLDGLFTTYEDKLNDRIDTLNEDYETASDKLDEKYEQMATQFAEYTVLITQMETAFESLKLIIDGSSDS